MAKEHNPYGLRPVRRVDGLPYAGQVRHFAIESEYGEDINFGDLVAVNDDGYLVRVSGTTDLGSGVVGVFAGVHLEDNGEAPIFAPFGDKWVAGTKAQSARGYVIDDPFVVFQIQADGTLGQDALGKCFAIVNPGDTGLKVSNIALNASSAGASGPFKVVGFVRNLDSEVGDDYTDVEVIFTPGSHAYLDGTGVS